MNVLFEDPTWTSEDVFSEDYRLFYIAEKLNDFDTIINNDSFYYAVAIFGIIFALYKNLYQFRHIVNIYKSFRNGQNETVN